MSRELREQHELAGITPRYSDWKVNGDEQLSEANIPPAKKMLETCMKEAKAAKAALGKVQAAINLGYDEPGWNEMQHEALQKQLDGILEAVSEALGAVGKVQSRSSTAKVTAGR